MRTITATQEAPPKEGSRRVIDGIERVFYCGYWIKTYAAPADSLDAKKKLIEALTRRLFNHTEHGLNIPGSRLAEARNAYLTEADPARRRVKAGMLAGALFNRATDIFRRLVELQAEGIEVNEDFPLVSECGKCLLEAMELGKQVLHRSGEEGLDELWGEPFRAFSIPVEEFYESRYIKIAQCMRDIDGIAACMIVYLASLPAFQGVEQTIIEFATAARIKTETLRTDPDIFDVWARFATASERLANFTPNQNSGDSHCQVDGLELLHWGRNLIFYIVRARTPMPKSMRDYIDRCEKYHTTGDIPPLPTPLPG